jgi:magnesium transporter
MHAGVATTSVIPFAQTAKGRMTPRVPIIESGKTLADLQALLWKSVATFDTIRDAFIVDKKHHLIGTVSNRAIFDHPLSTRLDDIMVPAEKVVKVLTTDDQEVAVQRALQHSIESVAVVNHEGKFFGAISIKELMRILQQETQEDLAAEGRYDMSPKLDSILEVSLWESFRNRAPWILVGVGGGMVVATIISFFEDLLSHHIILVGFIPLIVYIVGAVSAQLQMLYVRDSAIYPTLPLRQYVLRQGAVVLLISATLGIVLYTVGSFYPGLDTELVTLSVATVIAALTALVTGVLVPHGLSKVVRDPANATAPIATIFSDTATIVIFFAVASVLLV